MSIPTFEQYRGSVLAFVERCAPGDGVFDAAAWEAGGASHVLDPRCSAYVVPREKRRIRVKTLEQRMQDNDWAFASTPGGVESLEGGHSAIETLYLLGALDRLGPGNRRAWVEQINRWQDTDTGYYLGPYVPPKDHPSWRNTRLCTHPWAHMHDHLVSCLCPTLMLLGGKCRVPLSRGRMTGRFLDREYLKDFLRGRDWNHHAGDGNYRRHNPWYVGNEFWGAACILWQIAQWEAGTPAADQARRLLDEVWYDWHDRNFGVNGFWYGDLDGPPERSWRGSLAAGCRPTIPSNLEERYWAAVPIMGAAHQLWLYGFEGHPIPDDLRRRQTDNVLALQNRHHGRFGLGDTDNPAEFSNNCTDVDCMTILAMNRRAQDYRRDDVERALHVAAKAILRDKINAEGVLQSQPGMAFSHCFNSTPTFSPGDQGNLLDQSFYLWAVVAACSVVRASDDPAMGSFLDHAWPRLPSHWLWTPACGGKPGRHQQKEMGDE